MKIKNIFTAHLEYVALLIIVFFVVEFFPNNSFWDYIGKCSGLLGISILLYYIYKDKKERSKEKDLARFFSEEVDKIVTLILISMQNMVKNLNDLSDEWKKTIKQKHLRTFLNNERTSIEQEYEIISDCFEFIQKKLKFSIAEKLFLQYLFLKGKKETSIERFKSNLPSEGMLRKEFDLLITAYENNLQLNILGLRIKAQEITADQLKKQKEKWNKKEILYNELKESLNKNESAMNSILTVGRKLFSEGNIREVNLLSLSKLKKSIIVINRKEVALLKSINKYQNIPPLTKIIEENGFIKVFSRGDMFVKKDESFDSDEKFKKLIEKIKLKTNQIWTQLKNTPEGKKLKGVIDGDKYKMIVTRMTENDFQVYNHKYPFTEEFNDKIISTIQPDEAIALIAEHPHKVKDILYRIDIDNLAEGFPDELKKIIFRRRKKIKNAIYKQTGYEIKGITDIRNLKNKEKELISILSPIIKDENISFIVSDMDIKNLANSMISNSEEYYLLLQKLGVL
ncbi:MAG: hypothetical protein KKF46_05765 [Nanoarchaeota archaeon]|nr:hypothetical protein [Nanoarchaeota archaeon]MBU1321839.1 hypothetical protein [Nanoarchaeota archaeon]MBU1597184.1 hypothetical protein [Nanoarchaeota archaeon]MBU2441883.1 hypothetical protein [Nanoarchaeota archaeon]